MKLFRKKEKIKNYVERENKITDITYEWNLYFYTILKSIVQVALNDNKLITLQNEISKNKNNCI